MRRFSHALHNTRTELAHTLLSNGQDDRGSDASSDSAEHGNCGRTNEAQRTSREYVRMGSGASERRTMSRDASAGGTTFPHRNPVRRYMTQKSCQSTTSSMHANIASQRFVFPNRSNRRIHRKVSSQASSLVLDDAQIAVTPQSCSSARRNTAYAPAREMSPIRSSDQIIHETDASTRSKSSCYRPAQETFPVSSVNEPWFPPPSTPLSLEGDDTRQKESHAHRESIPCHGHGSGEMEAFEFDHDAQSDAVCIMEPKPKPSKNERRKGTMIRPSWVLSWWSQISNSFFAWQVLLSSLIILALNAISISIVSLQTTQDSDTGKGITESCQDQYLIVHGLSTLNILLGLPAVGTSRLALYSQNQQTGFVLRKPYLFLCEFVAVMELCYLFAILVIWIVKLSNGDVIGCVGDGTMSDVVFGISIIVVAMVYVHLTLFAQFRVHQKMQLGSRKDMELETMLSKHSSHPTIMYIISSCFSCSSTRKEKERLRDAVYMAAMQGNLIRVEALLTQIKEKFGGDDALGEMYQTPTLWLYLFAFSTRNPLHLACSRGNVALVDLLLRAGFDPNLLDKSIFVKLSVLELYNLVSSVLPTQDDSTVYSSSTLLSAVLLSPLHLAVLNGHRDIVDLLLRYNADINILAKSSFTKSASRLPAIFLADSVVMMECLLRNGANLLLVPGSHQSTRTLTILQFVALQDRTALRNVLEQWGGDVALTPLHTAAACNDASTVAKLLNRGVYPDTLGEFSDGINQRTALHWAAVMGSEAVIRVLVQKQANFDAVDRMGRTALHWAVRNNRVEAVRALAEAGGNPNCIDNAGYSAFTLAAEAGLARDEVFKVLVENGGNINYISPLCGDSALHIAIKRQHRETALALLRNQADLWMVNREGRRPLDCTVSAELQFTMKKEAMCHAVIVTYTPDYFEFAAKISDGIEASLIPTYLKSPSELEPEDEVKRREMRREFRRSLETASVLLCVLSKDFETNERCLEELALAKQIGKAVVAVFCDKQSISEELQVYLYTRQIIPFQSTIESITPAPQSTSPKPFEFRYNEAKFTEILGCLIDGLRDEIEMQRLDIHSNPLPTQATQSGTFLKRTNLASMRINSSTMLSTSSALESYGQQQQHALPTTNYSGMARLSALQGTHKQFVFLSHGDCHTTFVQQLYSSLLQANLNVFLDSKTRTSSLKDRILEGKDAILQCGVFVVVLSPQSVKTQLVSDQLAFAEDKGKKIVPVFLNDPVEGMQSIAGLHMDLLFFSEDLGYEEELDHLIDQLKILDPVEKIQ